MTEFKTPGQLLTALLAERGWAQRTLATVLERQETTINKIISGKGSVTVDLALAFESVLGVPAERFLELQRNYDLAVARLTAKPDPGRQTRAHLFGELPIGQMIKRGWLEAEDSRDVRGVERALMDFFGAPDPNEIEIIPHAAKKTEVSEPANPPALAWLYRVRQIATEMMVGRFTDSSADRAITRLKALLLSAEEARHVPRVLAENGIRFLLVETLPGAKIDGVCMWLNPTSPVIALTTRHDRIDNFWFVLRHELEHVRLKHGIAKIMLDTELEGDKAGANDLISEEERLANAAASEFCVPAKTMDAFIRKKAPLFAERDLLGLAKTIQVHPGLVAGQLQHRTKDYRKFRPHLVPVRSIVAPSAIVDGWGDIYPLDKGI